MFPCIRNMLVTFQKTIEKKGDLDKTFQLQEKKKEKEQD